MRRGDDHTPCFASQDGLSAAIPIAGSPSLTPLPRLALAGFALPLPSCCLTSGPAIFGFGPGDGVPFLASISLADFALPLPSCFLTSGPAIFGFGPGDGVPFLASISLADFALPLPS